MRGSADRVAGSRVSRATAIIAGRVQLDTSRKRPGKVEKTENEKTPPSADANRRGRNREEAK